MPTKIFVGNLSSDTTGDDLRPLFEQYGEVTESDVLRNFGFVHMANEEEANEAIFQLSGAVVKGQRINVEKSTGSAPRGGRGGGMGGGKMMGGGGFRGRGSSRGGPGRGRGGRDFDAYPGPPRSGPYNRDPYYDFYDRPYPGERLPPPRPSPYPEDRLSMYDREDRLRQRDPYEPYPPPPRYSDPYLDRYPPPRSSDPYERPPPHYYRAYDGYDDPVRRPPPDEGAQPPNRNRAMANGFEEPRREPQPPGGDSYSSSYSSYYDRFYNKPPTNGERAAPGAGRPAPQGRGGLAAGQQRKDQHQLQTGPPYF